MKPPQTNPMTSKPINGDGFNGDTTSKPIHLFRIMHHETLSQGKLRIPEKFVMKYGESLSNTMFLKLPNGAEWKVHVEKHDDGRVWFHNGWKEFEEYYSLAHGHLLVFKFDGTSHFHVHIYDMSTMEIDYPLNKVDLKRANNSQVQPPKTSRTGRKNKDEGNSNLQDRKGILKNPTEEKRSIQQNTKRSSTCNYRPHQIASNTSFTMKITSQCYLRWSVKLPKGSMQGYIKPGPQKVTLLVGDKSWTVKLIHYPNIPSSSFSAGWPMFAGENNLKVEDTCLFELLNSSKEMVMKVSIFKRHLC